MNNENSRPLHVWILAIALAIGLLGAGFFISQGVYHAKAQDRYITVKGLATRDVKATLGVWEIGFRRVGDNLITVNQQLNKDQAQVLAFLKNKGFAATDIELKPAKVTDLFADPYSSARNDPNAQKRRYIVTGGVQVHSTDVDLIQRVSQQVSELLSQGISLTFDSPTFGPNPSYFYTALDSIRPAMLAEATQSARTIAEQFVKDSHSNLGGIRRASQGVFQIMGRNAEDGSNSQDQLGALYKKVRLVTTVDYLLN